MAQISITGHIHHSVGIDGKDNFTVFSFDATNSKMGYVYVGPVEINYTIPAGWNAIASKVAALQQERDEAAKQFADTVRRIDEQIGKLTAIGCEVAA